MRFEINYNIKTSELLGTNMKDKKLILKSYAGENNGILSMGKRV